MPLALGMGMAAFAAVLVAPGGIALGATSGLARTVAAAIALTAVAVTADGYSAAAAGAQKLPRWWLGGLHGHSCPCAKTPSGQPRILREILQAQRCSPERGVSGRDSGLAG